MAKIILVLTFGPGLLCEIYVLSLVGGSVLGWFLGLHIVFGLVILYKVVENAIETNTASSDS